MPNEVSAMRKSLAWGGQQLELDVADKDFVEVRRDAIADDVADPAAAVRAALEQPRDYPALRRALTPDDHVAVVVDEGLPGLAGLLVPVLEHIRSAGVTPDAMTLLCLPPSTGQPWLDELPDEFEEVHVEVHQPQDRRKLAYLATTKRGRRVYLNRSAVDADLLVVLTRRTFDPLVGYAGGETAIYPGLCDDATQQEMRTKLHAEVPGREGWAVSREAVEVAWLLGAPFLVQVIEGHGDDVARVLGGPVESAAEGRRLLDSRWRVETDRYADVVVAGLDGDPTRLTAEDLARAFFNASRVVRAGGAVALLTDATPALGRSFEVLRRHDDPAAALRLLFDEKPNDLAAGFMWASAANQAKLYLLSGLDDDLAEEMFTTPLTQPGQVQRLVSHGETCLILPEANKTLASVR